MTNQEYIDTHPWQFKDDIDRWLFNELSISGGACSAQRSLEYSVARQVAEKLWNRNLWQDAQGDNLPEIDREVIVIGNVPVDEFRKLTSIDEDGLYRVSFAHRPNPDGWDGKSISTGKVEHYYPQIYDRGGWNIPYVKYWLDIELPFNDDEL